MSAKILDLMRQGATRSYNEGITELNHALMSAYLAETKYRLDESMIVACLLHDIGHLIAPVDHPIGNPNHAKIGAAYLRDSGFPESIYNAVGNHVLAKRYLKTINPHYQLGAASLAAYYQQGGPLERPDLWISHPESSQWLLLRQIDDEAKFATFPSDYTLDRFGPMIDRILASSL